VKDLYTTVSHVEPWKPGPVRRVTVTIDVVEGAGKQSPRGTALEQTMAELESVIDNMAVYVKSGKSAADERAYHLSMIKWEPA
jgi:hypothetical protein